MTLPTTWSVEITAAGGAAPADGFIDHRRLEIIMAGGSSPTTFEHSKAKARAFLRFKFMVEQLQTCGNIYVSDMVATGATATTAATKFTCLLTCERGDSILSTEDEANGGVVLTGADALKRMIARSLLDDRTIVTAIYDPVAIIAQGNDTTAVRVGQRIESLEVGKIASNLTTATALITVNKIA